MKNKKETVKPEVGHRRLFSFKLYPCVIKKIIPNLKLNFEWIKSNCPHCKKPISSNHLINTIEILEELNTKDVVIMGFCDDGHTFHIKKDNILYNQILNTNILEA